MQGTLKSKIVTEETLARTFRLKEGDDYGNVFIKKRLHEEDTNKQNVIKKQDQGITNDQKKIEESFFGL